MTMANGDGLLLIKCTLIQQSCLTNSIREIKVLGGGDASDEMVLCWTMDQVVLRQVDRIVDG